MGSIRSSGRFATERSSARLAAVDGVLFLGLVVGGATVFAVGFLIRWRQAVRTRQAMAAEVEGDRCVACSSADILAFGSEAYRCNACGFEFGDGLLKLRREARRKVVEQMDPLERRKGGIADLKEAHLMLLAAQGHVDRAVNLCELERSSRNVDDTHDEEKQEALRICVGEAQRAHWRIEDARMKLGAEQLAVGPSHIEVDFGSLAFRSDSIVGAGDAGVRQEVDRVQAHVARVMREVELDIAKLS